MFYIRGETILREFQLLPHFVQLCLIIPPITEEVTVPTPNHCHSLNTSRTWTVNHRPSISQHQPQYITDQANGRSLHSNGSVPSRCIFVWCHILRQQNQKWKTKDGLSVSFMEAVWRNILSSSEVWIYLSSHALIMMRRRTVVIMMVMMLIMIILMMILQNTVLMILRALPFSQYW